jgi:hypothetical protein
MQVIKRNGTIENFQTDKLENRINHLIFNLKVEPKLIVDTLVKQFKHDVQTSLLDNLCADICTSMSEPDYQILGTRLSEDVLIKNTKVYFSKVESDVKDEIDSKYTTSVRNLYKTDGEFKITYFDMKTRMKNFMKNKYECVELY